MGTEEAILDGEGGCSVDTIPVLWDERHWEGRQAMQGLMVINTVINELKGRALPNFFWSNLSYFDKSQTLDPCGLRFCIL